TPKRSRSTNCSYGVSVASATRVCSCNLLLMAASDEEIKRLAAWSPGEPACCSPVPPSTPARASGLFHPWTGAGRRTSLSRAVVLMLFGRPRSATLNLPAQQRILPQQMLAVCRVVSASFCITKLCESLSRLQAASEAFDPLDTVMRDL